MIGRRATRLLAAIVTCLIAIGCAPSSNVQPSPTIMGTPTVASPPATPAPPTGAATAQPAATETPMPEPMSITSPEFADGRPIPKRFTCDGANVSPPLEWTGVPAGAASLALIVRDPDAHDFVHWVVFDIDVSATGGLPTGWSTTPDAAPQGRNGFGKLGWGGPCPPSGTHRYVFRLLALDVPLALQGAPSADDVLGAADGHTLGEATLTGSYTRA